VARSTSRPGRALAVVGRDEIELGRPRGYSQISRTGATRLGCRRIFDNVSSNRGPAAKRSHSGWKFAALRSLALRSRSPAINLANA
jgi:hypothetical protein